MEPSSNSKIAAIAPFVVAFVLTTATAVQAQTLTCPGHSQLVTITPEGEVEEGSLAALRRAYRNGNPLRVGWELDFDGDGSPNVTRWAEASFLSEFEGIIAAQVAHIERQLPRPEAASIDFGDEPQRWSGLLSTDGTLLGRFSDGKPRRDKVRGVWCLAAGDRRAECTERWRMVYHHDADGNRIDGDKQRLFDAVRRGRPIRLAWGMRHPSDEAVSVEHVAEPVFVTITGGELFAQLPEHIAQQGYADPDLARFDKPSVMWRAVMGTTGAFDAVWVDRASGEQVRRMPQRARVAWSVHGPAPACETDEPIRLAVPEGIRMD